jgi:hypothetical protein
VFSIPCAVIVGFLENLNDEGSKEIVFLLTQSEAGFIGPGGLPCRRALVSLAPVRRSSETKMLKLASTAQERPLAPLELLSR